MLRAWKRAVIGGVWLLWAWQTAAFGATRGDVNVLEATESIRYLSQKMAREYIYVYLNPENRYAERNLRETIALLSKNIQTVSAASNDDETDTMIAFLAYTKEQIEEIVAYKPTKENVALMLDFSETLLEGADAIARAHMYDFGNEEKMLVTSKNIQYLAERVLKFYLALYIGEHTTNNKQQLARSAKLLYDDMAKMKRYAYPEKLAQTLAEVDKVWGRTGTFIRKAQQKNFYIPELVSDAVSLMEKRVDDLVLYHSKKL